MRQDPCRSDEASPSQVVQKRLLRQGLGQGLLQRRTRTDWFVTCGLVSRTVMWLDPTWQRRTHVAGGGPRLRSRHPMKVTRSAGSALRQKVAVRYFRHRPLFVVSLSVVRPIVWQTHNARNTLGAEKLVQVRNMFRLGNLFRPKEGGKFRCPDKVPNRLERCPRPPAPR